MQQSNALSSVDTGKRTSDEDEMRHEEKDSGTRRSYFQLEVRLSATPTHADYVSM